MRAIKPARDQFGHKRYTVRMSFLIVPSVIVWVLQIVPLLPIWSSFRTAVINIYGNEEKLIDALSSHREFLATVAWTLTTVLSTFLVAYYDRQGSSHYGVSQRKIISFGTGYLTIPLCILMNVVIVLIMTTEMYSPYNGAFYFHAGSSIVLQLILIFYCIYVSSNKYSLDKIKELELDWVQYDNRKGNVHIVPMMLDGAEPISEQFEALTQVLKQSITSINDEFLITYLMDNLSIVASKTEQMSFFYDMVAELLKIEGDVNAGEQIYSKRSIVLCSALNAAADRDEGVWDFLKMHSKSTEDLSLLRSTLSFMILTKGYLREPLDEDVVERIRNLFEESSSIGDALSKHGDYYRKWINILLGGIAKDEYVETIYTSAKTDPSPNVNGSLRAARRLNALGGKS